MAPPCRPPGRISNVVVVPGGATTAWLPHLHLGLQAHPGMLIPGIPYNSQCQGLVERKHKTLKEWLQKQQGVLYTFCPHDTVCRTLYQKLSASFETIFKRPRTFANHGKRFCLCISTDRAIPNMGACTANMGDCRECLSLECTGLTRRHQQKYLPI